MCMNTQTFSSFQFWFLVLMKFNAVMLGYDNVSSGTLVPSFRRHTLPAFSGRFEDNIASMKQWYQRTKLHHDAVTQELINIVNIIRNTFNAFHLCHFFCVRLCYEYIHHRNI